MMKGGETGYLGSSLLESKIHGYLSNLFQIPVALHYTFPNHLQLSLYNLELMNLCSMIKRSNKVHRPKLLTSKMIIISLHFYIFQ
jgi:hypothetical protein